MDVAGNAVIEDGCIVIRLDISALPYVWGYSDNFMIMDPYYKVSDPLVLARDVVSVLNSDNGEGETLIHKIFDSALMGALESGSLGFDEIVDESIINLIEDGDLVAALGLSD